MNGEEPEQRIQHRRDEQVEPLERIVPAGQRGQVIDPLCPGKAAVEQAALSQRLDRPSGPPLPLADQRAEIVGRRPLRQSPVDRAGAVSRFLDLEAGREVLRNGLLRKETDLLQRPSEYHGIAAAADHGIYR